MSVTRRELLLAEFGTWGYDTRGWRPITRKEYVGRVKALEDWLQEKRKKSVLWASPKDLQAWLFSAPTNPSTRNHYRQAIVAFFAFLVEREYVDVNHALALPRLKRVKSLPRWLRPAEAHAVEQAAKMLGPLTECLVLVYLYQGVRHTACRLLQWPSMDLEHRLFIYEKKGGGEKSLRIHRKPLGALRTWREECPHPLWVFPSPLGPTHNQARSQTWVANTVRRVGAEAGIPHLHPHMLRHTFATRLIMKKVDVRTVQELLGHESLSSTQIYLHAFSENLDTAIDQLDYDEDD